MRDVPNFKCRMATGNSSIVFKRGQLQSGHKILLKTKKKIGKYLFIITHIILKSYFPLQTTFRVVSTAHLLVSLSNTFHCPPIVGHGEVYLLLIYPHLASADWLTPHV